MSEENILDLVTHATRGDYYIPEIQRGFVWTAEQVRRLCDSLYKDFPINMFLLWDNPNYIQPQTGAPNARRQPPLWIIDGQQRITTLCLLFGQKPWWYGPDEWADLQKRCKVFMNIDLESGVVKFSGRPEEGARTVVVPEVMGKQQEAGIVELAQRVSGGDAGIVQRVVGPLLQLWNTRRSLVSVIVVRGKEPEEVAEIFERLNRAGTRIKETDTRLALIAASNPGWKRDTFDLFIDELDDKGWNIPPGYLLQAMTVFHLGKARMKDADATRTFWTEDVVRIWGTFREVVDEVITFLWDKGIPAIDLIPSEYTLIPLFAAHAKFRGKPGYSFDDLYRWFLVANMEGRYSGAPLENLTNDASSIYQSTTCDEAISKMPPEEEITIPRLESIFKEPFRKGEFASLLIHLLLWQKGARDWLQSLTLRAAGTNNGVLRPHWHHIMPKAWAKRNSFENTDWAANVTILTESTNVRRLGSRPPWEYVPRNGIAQQALEEHFIPEEFAQKFVNGRPLGQEEFTNFLQARASLLAAEALTYLK